ncbi:formate dehydrogenase, partial [Micromonospora sp. NPDC047620]
MGIRQWITEWPVYRQLTGDDPLGKAAAAQSGHSRSLQARTTDADRVVTSVCPYCGVGCSQRVYVKDEKVVQIEGNPDSPVSRGRLCPKGAASLQLTTGEARRHQVLYRPPHATDWQPIGLERAMDMVADRVIATRRAYWQDEVDGNRTARTMGIAS